MLVLEGGPSWDGVVDQDRSVVRLKRQKIELEVG